MRGPIFKTVVALLIVGLLTVSMLAAPVAAQEGDADHGTSSAQESDPEANLPYLFAVYTVTWIAFFAYLFYLSQKQRDLRAEIESLRRTLSEEEG